MACFLAHPVVLKGSYLSARRYLVTKSHCAGTQDRMNCSQCSVYKKSEFYRNGWTNRVVFLLGSFFRPILYCIIRKLEYLRKCTFLWNFFPCSELREFRHDRSIVEMCNQLRSRSEHDKLDRRRSKVDSASELRQSTASLSQWSSSSVYSATPSRDSWQLWSWAIWNN